MLEISVSWTVLTREPRGVGVKIMSTVGGVAVVRTGARIVGCRFREELTVTRVTVMIGSVDKILVLIFSGVREEFQSTAAWSVVEELEDNTDTTRGTSMEMLDT
jgi:hypothetical protein